MDTAKDQWSIAAGTYSSRFASGTAVAAHMAAVQMRDKLKSIAAKQLNVLPEDVELNARQNPQPKQSRQRAAVRPRRRDLALVAGAAAGKHGAGAVRNRRVDAAGA